ncbi:Acyltransferase LovD [Cytospora mali]|uniref:Acyltransferase LovD n=1 Tax=Cytospora mali TaxID=578113 RepID=A0A194UMH4_CYTMA|nr:Acyltransferase LovD [Valsa mali var. pyri (nom. inval.)]
MEEAFEAACAKRTIPGSVLSSADMAGKFYYSKSFGVRSLKEPLVKEALSLHSTMWIASCTKLLTSIAAMQCVERGLVSLDQDVRPILHELQNLDIIQAMADDHGGEGVLSMRKNVAPITLRQLLTHTSGFSYEFNEPLLQKWRRQQPESERQRPPTSVHNRFLHPLLYEPGTSWSYGPSLDWVGVLVERLTGSNLQDYMTCNIWEPLGITDMTFFLSKRADMQARITEMSWRDPGEDPEVQNRPVKYALVQPALNPDMEDCQGGGGIYASPSEYFKVVHALLLARDGKTQLLRKSTVDTIFQPQLGTASRKALQTVCQNPWFNRMMGGMPVEARKDWGLGGLLLLDDLPGWRGSGTMTWGGTPNLTWWIDRKAGLCGLYAGQVMPIGDAKCVELNQVFEKEMYVRYQKASEDP